MEFCACDARAERDEHSLSGTNETSPHVSPENNVSGWDVSYETARDEHPLTDEDSTFARGRRVSCL